MFSGQKVVGFALLQYSLWLLRLDGETLKFLKFCLVPKTVLLLYVVANIYVTYYCILTQTDIH